MPKRKEKLPGPLKTTTANQFLDKPKTAPYFNLERVGYSNWEDLGDQQFDLLYTNCPDEHSFGIDHYVKPTGYIAIWDQVSNSSFIEFPLLFQIYLTLTGLDFGQSKYPPKDVFVLNVYGNPDNPLYKPLQTSSLMANVSIERNINKDPYAIPFSVSTKILNLLCPPTGTVFDPYPNNGSIARASILSGRETRIMIPDKNFHQKLQTTLYKAYERI